MARLPELARRTDWRTALLDVHGDDAALWKRYADESAGQWKVLLPASARGRALWLDGPGGAALALARWCESLVVRCETEDDAEFLGVQADQMGLGNLEAVTHDPEEGAFDLVATADGRVDLAAARRALNASGHLFVAAPNRWTDPQPGASGYGGWRRRLRAAGLSDCRVYGLLPDELLSFDDPSPRDGLPFRERLKRKRRLCPLWGFVAHASDAGESWLVDFWRHACGRFGIDERRTFPRMHGSGAASHGLLVFLGETALARVPLDFDSEAGVERNFAGLEAARGRTIPAPEPMAHDRYEGVPYGIEGVLPGKSIRDLPRGEWDAPEERMFEILMGMQAESSRAGAAERWVDEVAHPLVQAVAWARTDGDRALAQRVADRAAAIAPTLPLVFTHGDLHLGNVMVDADGTVRVFDWDSWHEADFASIDFVHFVCQRRWWREDTGPMEALLDWLENGPLDEAESAWTERFVRHHGLPDGWQAQAALSYWARELAPRVDSAYDLDRRWIRRNYLAVLPRIDAALG